MAMEAVAGKRTPNALSLYQRQIAAYDKHAANFSCLEASPSLHCPKQGLKRCKVGGTPTCVDIQTDVNHCGNCKSVCPSGDTCIAGVCTSPPTPPCTAASSCGNPIDCGSADNCFCLAGTTKTSPDCYDASDESCFDCTSDADCTTTAGGICAQNTCCPNGACVYPSGNCPNGATAARRSLLGEPKGRKAGLPHILTPRMFERAG